jgi:hypothetical protein
LIFVDELRIPVAPVAHRKIQPKRLKILTHDHRESACISAQFMRQMLGYSVIDARFKRIGRKHVIF